MNNSAKSFFLSILVVLNVSCQSKEPDYSAYLFAYFVGNGPGQEQVHYAVSRDGYNYSALNDNKPIVDTKDISRSGGVRDPHILRSKDGNFYMVLTDLYVPEMGWQNTAMIMLKSPDLINWTHTVIDIPQTYTETFGDVYRVWAPQTVYDESTDQYMLYWSMLQPGGRDIIYYSYANEDFTGLESEPKQLLYKDGACIDGDIVFKDGTYYLFFKNEDRDAKGIMLATSDKINEGYEVQEGFVDQTDDAVEGSGTFKLIGTDKYILMYDVYTSGRYEFCESTDLQNFTVIDKDISMDFHPRHGSVIPITEAELHALVKKWGGASAGIVSAKGSGIKSNNIVVDNERSTVYLPVKPGTDLSTLDPQFVMAPGREISPKGSRNFSNGAVEYTVTIGGETTKTFSAKADVAGNPVLDGYYADPEIIYSQREQKYYLYPTSDGFNNWSGTYFETFSSSDLVNWKKEEIILDLKKDVEWADRNAWAPTIKEKKVDGKYKYFYYFTAAQKIGVAVADSPTGPFIDSGQPLIDFKPDGINRGQEIDPDVFTDPQTGKSYLYWGNGYMAVAELNDDMTSIKKEIIKVLTPDQTFREGAEVFFRNGKYYFLWSEDDTRSPNYRVRYATAESPLGPLDIPEKNMVIQKDEDSGIFGTGHNSVINKPGTDEWFIVYHRFTRPKGISMGRSAGFHREVCIDRLTFSESGAIQTVTPTLDGILP